jgi:hypothetical protein
MIAQGANAFAGMDCPANTYGAAGRVYGLTSAPCKPCPRNMITDLQVGKLRGGTRACAWRGVAWRGALLLQGCAQPACTAAQLTTPACTHANHSHFANVRRSR